MGPAHSGQTRTWAQTVGFRAGWGRGAGVGLVGAGQGIGDFLFRYLFGFPET